MASSLYWNHDNTYLLLKPWPCHVQHTSIVMVLVMMTAAVAMMASKS